MGLLSKIFGGSTLVLLLLAGTLFFSNQNKEKKLNKAIVELKQSKGVVDSLKKKDIYDSLNHTNIVRELQSTIGQMNNLKKSLERENSNLRKGIRLDLLVVRQRRSGKSIDSTYTIGYKYLDK